MNGAHSLVHTLLKSGVDTCFANPGTSEMHFVAALDQIPGMRCVLGLQENVVTGMADGYFRMAGKPASTLLHCGPGLANGLANLHNARRARSGIVNIVGDQATFHRAYDAPLTADTEGWARPVSSWVRTSMRSADVGRDAAVAVQQARTAPGGIATLILPSDVSWDEGGQVADPLPVPPAVAPDPHAVQAVARLLREKRNVLLLLGGTALSEASLALAWRIAAATGAKLLTEGSNARIARGRGRVQIERVPYVGEIARKILAEFDHIVLVNAKAPVGFFAYPGKPSIHYREDAVIEVLTRYEGDATAALQAVADELKAPTVAIPEAARLEAPRGAPTPEKLAAVVSAYLPEGAIVSDESVSYGRGFFPLTHGAAPHDWLQLTGGAIGDGMPVATGAALGSGRKRRVVSLQVDGSGMYSVQSLWTQARERLPVTTIILSNRKYNILIGEYAGVGANPGPTAMNMLDLGNPDLNWVKLAEGMGVAAAACDNLEDLGDLLKESFKRDEPFVIELIV